MKKQLLSTLLFLIAISFASGQSEAEVTDVFTTQNFTVGANKDLQDASIVNTITGSGSAQTNKNGWLAILGDATETPEGSGNYTSSDDTTGKMTFTIKSTTSGFPANVTITLIKRAGGTITGTFTGDGESTSIDNASDGSTTTNSLETYTVTLSGVDITTASKTFEINMTSILIGTQTAAGVPTLRLTNVAVQNTDVASTNDVDTVSGINLFPNPATDSFKVDSSDEINNVSVYSLNGQLVKSFSASSSYDVSNLATGLYSVRINTANGSKTVKLIKK